MIAIFKPAQDQRSEFGPHLLAVGTYSVGFAIVLLIRPLLGDQVWMVFQAIAGAIAFFYLWRRLYWAGNPLLSFGAILLIAGFLNRILYAIDAALNGSRLSEWPIPSNGEWWALARAEWMTVVGTIIIVFVWRRLGGVESSLALSSEVTRGRRSLAGYWILYTCAVGIELLRQQELLFPQIAQLATVTYASGVGAVLTINDRKASPARVILQTAVMSAPLIYLALGTAMKEAIIVAILPMVIVFWRRFNYNAARVVLIGLMCVSAAIATNFVEFYRERNWVMGETLSIFQALRSYSLDRPSRTSEGGVEGGLQDFLIRSNATYHRGWAIDLAEQDGYIPEQIFGALAYAFIPRFIWPEKPDIEPGQEHSGRLFGEAYRLSTTSSTAAGFFPALYMGGGWIAVFIGAWFTGWMVGLLTRFLNRTGNPYSISAFGWIVLLYALRLDETWPVYALSSPIISFVYVIALGSVIVTIAEFLGSPRGNDRTSPKGARVPERNGHAGLE